MDTGFLDLDVLLSRVRHAPSKSHFLDAVRAYKAGALRAAMTSIWVALVYDLIAKYRELSAMGDAAATAFLSSWDSATASGDVKKLLQLEASILEDATNKTQVVSRIAGVHLQRLRDDRHLCAHPAFSAEADLFEPSAELVRLHLANAVELVLSQEPLQGKAIFDLYDADVQSPGFPTAHERILDYVDQRYLQRVRTDNIRNFGVVLAKSLLKGVPPQWEPHYRRIVSSLVAVQERAPHVWPDTSQSIVRLIDSLGPAERPRAIALVAAFPGLWPRLLDATRTALQHTAEQAEPAALTDFRILAGVALPALRPAILALINRLSREDVARALSVQPFVELWARAIQIYGASGGFRASEANFRELITPFAGRLTSQQFNDLLDAIVENGQNWDAAETDQLLLAMLRVDPAVHPTREARDRFYQKIRRFGRHQKYREVLTLFSGDGWTAPPLEPEEDED